MNKIATDIEQSKKLAEILPIESADMVLLHEEPYETSDSMFDGLHQALCVPFTKYDKSWRQKYKNISYFPCWSLAALLKLMPKHILRKDKIHYGQTFIPSFRWEITPTAIYYTDGNDIMNYTSFKYGENNIELIDAAFKMVVWLKEKRLL